MVAERLTAWPVDRYFPRELQMLQAALEELFLCSHDVSGGSNSGPRAPGHSDIVATSVTRTAVYRRHLDKMLAQVKGLTDRCSIPFREQDDRERGRDRGGPRCQECGRKGRVGARFCDGCGGDLRKAG